MATAPNPSTAGQAVLISGQLRGPRRSHAVVLLWRRLPGQKRFHPVAATRADRSRHYSTNAVIDGNRWWYVTARGFRSRTVHQRVQARITLVDSDTRAAPGDQVSFTGAVAPSHSRAQIVLEQLGSAGWQPVGHGVLDSTSSFSINYEFSGAGTYQLRTYLRWGTHNINSYSPTVTVTVNPIFKIKHVVIIMQENRSFDHYFGTFRGADGIPGLAGNPGALPCVPDPVNGGCVQPFHDANDKNYGGPHGAANATSDIDCAAPATRTGCHMDGFVGQAEKGQSCTSTDPNCSPCTTATRVQCIDAMGYHDAGEIPNYWAYAKNYVLQDHMYEPNASWSLPQHLFMVSEWSAFCTDPLNPSSCTDALQNPNPSDGQPHYAWTDLTY
jgi:phospholipase C